MNTIDEAIRYLALHAAHAGDDVALTVRPDGTATLRAYDREVTIRRREAPDPEDWLEGLRRHCDRCEDTGLVRDDDTDRADPCACEHYDPRTAA